jgi:uncharacterized membrane protein YgcG
MKKYFRIFLFVLTIGTLLLSACGGAAATPNVGAGKVEAIPVAFVGMVDSIAGDQWVINGNTITVDPAIIRDGPFNAGDQVKVQGVVNPDGSFTVSRVETPTPQDVSTLPQFGNDNSNSANDNANDANVNAGNVNDDNSNTTNSNDNNGNDVNSNDDNSNAANSNEANANINDDHGNDNGSSVNSNSNTNDDQSNSGGNNDNGGGGGNDNGSGNDDSGGGGNDNGGNSNG